LKIRILIVLIYLLSQGGTSLFSQGFTGGSGERIEGKFKFIPLPYFNYDVGVGVSVGALPMAMFNLSEKDTISPSSIAGLGGMYSENGSWFGFGFARLYLKEDNWRITAAGGLGQRNFQFYIDNPISSWFPYTTQGDFAYIGLQRKIIADLYGGLSYVYISFETSTDLFDPTFSSILRGLGLSLSLDKRSSVYYPRNGILSEIEYNTYPEFMSNEQVSNQVSASYNQYFPSRNNKDVIAARFFGGAGIGDVNFNQQFIVGETDIRGYSQGRYRGNYMLSVQGEYRWNFHKRLGAVGFAGVATVFGSNNEDDNGKFLPGIGTGFRYMFMKDTQSNIGFDIAVGDGDWGFYFRFSEAF
jgi:hypothetical protein